MPLVDLNIGHRDAFNSYVDGLIDEVRIYKIALPSALIEALSS